MPTPTPNLPTPGHPGCTDKLDNCADYGRSVCNAPYDGWARRNCPYYCTMCDGKITFFTNSWQILSLLLIDSSNSKFRYKQYIINYSKNGDLLVLFTITKPTHNKWYICILESPFPSEFRRDYHGSQWMDWFQIWYATLCIWGICWKWFTIRYQIHVVVLYQCSRIEKYTLRLYYRSPSHYSYSALWGQN